MRWPTKNSREMKQRYFPFEKKTPNEKYQVSQDANLYSVYVTPSTVFFSAPNHIVK